MSTYIDAPKPFEGSEAQARANYRTHKFGESGVCWECDSKTWHVAASYPCGQEPPRIEMKYEDYMESLRKK